MQENHLWSGKKLKELPLPPDFLVVVIIRENQNIVPNGDTVIFPHDLLVVAAREFENRENLTLKEITVEKSSKWNGKPLKSWNWGRER